MKAKTKYAVTGRIGIVDTYNGLWNKFYRGKSQARYINLVPRDLFLVIGQMGQEGIFEKFDFDHEERLGRVLCKGVKYRKSFMPVKMSKKEAQESAKNYEACQKYIKNEEMNNYHPIPANKKIEKVFSILKYGDVVHLEGFLVDVVNMGLKTGTRKDQFHDNMIVNGIAPGMCFILYTTKVIFNGHEYQ